MATCPSPAATCSGVRPNLSYPSVNPTLPSCSSTTCTTSRQPPKTAKCRAESPCTLRACISNDTVDKSRRATSALPKAHATCSALQC